MLLFLDYGRRNAIEKHVDEAWSAKDPRVPNANVVFDESGYFILFSTMLGIKVSHASLLLTSMC